MKQRVITAIFMLLILAPLYLLGGWFSTILIVALASIGTYELVSMYQKKSNIPSICKYIIPLFSGIIVLISGIVSSGFAAAKVTTYSIIIIFVIFLVLSIFDRNICFKDCIFFIFFILYSGVTFGIFEFIRNLKFLPNHKVFGEILKFTIFNLDINAVGFIMMTYVLVCVMFTDMGGYTFGRIFGKHKLCPHISPKKTIEGAIGGTIVGALFGTLFIGLFLLILNPVQASAIKIMNISNNYLYLCALFGISIVVSIAGQLGDLVASKLKREFELKDFGNIFPGHGGVLDRFDSTILGGLIYYIILIVLGVML